MPTGNLPSEGKKLWEEVYQKAKSGSCKDASEPEACAAKSAWKAVENAGWHKSSDGKWSKKSTVQEFSLAFKSATIDEETGLRKWRADTSNTDDDKAGDNMTPELFKSFLDRIDNEELPPEEFRSDYWQGGMPYLSISHYPDLNGDAVPGDVEAVYVDGKYLKSKGTMRDTPLGDAAWKAITGDLNKIKSGDNIENKVRVSIAFLDYKHKHKSNDYIFERSSSEDICPECLVELIRGEHSGRSFLDGQLIHFAMTRVPMNEDTDISPDMLEERSMTSRKGDAASIIGEELAEELEEKALEIGKSEAIVIKAEEGETLQRLQSEVVIPEEFLAELKSLRELLDTKEEPEIKESHILDQAVENLKHDFDSVFASEVSSEEKLKAIQAPFNNFGQALVGLLRSEDTDEEVKEPENDLVKALSEIMSPISQKLDLINAQLAQQPQPQQIPVRRSIDPRTVSDTVSSGGVMSIRDISRKSVGLPVK